MSAQILLGLAGTAIWTSIPLTKQSGAWPLIWAFASYAPVVGIIASLLGAVADESGGRGRGLTRG